jgi:hypothetical protein
VMLATEVVMRFARKILRFAMNNTNVCYIFTRILSLGKEKETTRGKRIFIYMSLLMFSWVLFISFESGHGKLL